ncbi:MAG: SDR family NAD(P)-dependent oxidoreductase [Paludibacter sp.]|nr:SDR family NAD(P)-dependent oxidoreductase [Paludibacter sp.]
MKTNNWSTKDIPDLRGKQIIVTGGNSGLGFEAVKALAQKNAHVILACRNRKKGEEARARIVNLNPTSDVEVMELDLADLKSIDKFAANYTQKHTQLDVLINNAGIMMVPFGQTNDGFEKQVGTNHLGHYALTGLLLGVLKNTPKSRVVNVSSIAHKSGVMDFNNLLYTNGKDYSPMKAYGRSKLSNLLFTYELQRFFELNKIDSIAIAAHPGVSDTNLFDHVAPKWVMSILKPVFSLMTQPAYMGALPELRAATDPKAKGSEYYGPDGSREMKGYPVLVQPTKSAINKDDAKKLWELSEKLTHISYN